MTTAQPAKGNECLKVMGQRHWLACYGSNSDESYERYIIRDHPSPLPSNHHVTQPLYITTLVVRVLILFRIIVGGPHSGQGRMLS
jgi:hypothetical protein